ncbi:MAG: SDR family NAD(P)-dependent oxidoreductase [Kordiimonadaceae bacterium]|nr:SDR family NAD(P)-dependent oxidoreductase [Kordiimonadaceae bacterium]
MTKKSIIITGTSGFLGAAAYTAYRDHGGYVIHTLEGIDLTDNDKVREAINGIETIDVLINIAGGFIWKEIRHTSYSDFEEQLNKNFKTMYNVTMAALEKIENSKSGRIINIGATGAINPGPGMAAYAISKSAVMRFTEVLASETGDHVTVNAILPSIIDTPVNRENMKEADFSKWVTTKELVDQMVFLTSDMASGINGALIPVAGRI